MLNINSTQYNFQEIRKLCNLGLSLHWLQNGTKRPKEMAWNEVPNKTFEQLKTSYKQGCNLGCRLGKWSKFIDGTCLIVIDVDLKGGETHQAEALIEVKSLLGDNLSIYPFVTSGRGSHYYARILLENLLPNQKIAHSSKKCEVYIDNKIQVRHAWEIELLSTGKQVVMAGSLHPDTKSVYVWGKNFNRFEDIPLLPNSAIKKLTEKSNSNYVSTNLIKKAADRANQAAPKQKTQFNNTISKNYQQRFDKHSLPTPHDYYQGFFNHMVVRGKQAQVRCCFHNDRNPSMSLNLETGAFLCFSCGKRGSNIVNFYQHLRQVDFSTAMKALSVWRNYR